MYLEYINSLTAFREIEKTKCLYSKAWNKDGEVFLSIPEQELSTVKYCGKGIKLLFSLCKYCNRKYCLTHAIPEVHGCADEARRKVREKMFSDFVDEQKGRNEEPINKYKEQELRDQIKQKINAAKKKRMTLQAKKNLKSLKKSGRRKKK